jgi:hypothetical protein
MATQYSQGITTSLFAVNAADDAPEEPEENDTVEVGAEEASLLHDGHGPVAFQHHRQQGNREQVRGLPSQLKTSPLGSQRRGK